MNYTSEMSSRDLTKACSLMMEEQPITKEQINDGILKLYKRCFLVERYLRFERNN